MIFQITKWETFRARCQICSSLFLIKIFLTAVQNIILKHHLNDGENKTTNISLHSIFEGCLVVPFQIFWFLCLLILQSSWESMFFTLVDQLKASPNNNRIEYLSSGRWWWMNFHQVLFKSELWWWINLCKTLVWEPL